VDVSGEEVGKHVDLIIRIEDTGIGIPKEQVANVFQKFKQVDGTNTREYEGTGLGLSISATLIQLMGGYINVESVENEGPSKPSGFAASQENSRRNHRCKCSYH